MKEKSTMTVTDLAKTMGVSLPTAYNIVHSQGFPRIRVGKRIVIPCDAFERWLETASAEGLEIV